VIDKMAADDSVNTIIDLIQVPGLNPKIIKRFKERVLEKYGDLRLYFPSSIAEAMELWIKREDRKEKYQRESEKPKSNIRNRKIHLRVTAAEKRLFIQKAKRAGYDSLSQFIRDTVLKGRKNRVRLSKSNQERVREIKAYEKGDVANRCISNEEIEELVNRIIKIHYEEVW
jgi:hypothetical protein